MLKIIIFIMLLISSVNAEIIKTNSLETITEKHAELLINYDAKDIMMIVAFRDTMFTPFFPEMKNVDKAIIPLLKKIFATISGSKWKYFDTVLLTEYKNQLLDPNFPKFFKNIQDSGTSILAIDGLGLTGDFNDIDNLSIWKSSYLKEFGIQLGKNFEEKYLVFNNMTPFESNYPEFYHGILSCNGADKTQLIINFLIEMNLTPKILIMLDSNMNDLQILKSQLNQYNSNIQVLRYHYTLEIEKKPILNNSFIKKLEVLISKANSVKRKAKNSSKKLSVDPYDKKK